MTEKQKLEIYKVNALLFIAERILDALLETGNLNKVIKSNFSRDRETISKIGERMDASISGFVPDQNIDLDGFERQILELMTNHADNDS